MNNNITDKEIYQAASALLTKFGNDEWRVFDFLQAQRLKYFSHRSVDAFTITLRIEAAVKELVATKPEGTIH